MRFLLMRREVVEGGRRPRFYGVAYVADTFDGMVCYPVGINLVVRWARALWHWLVDYVPADWELRAMKKVEEARADIRKVELEWYAKGYNEACSKFLQVAGMVGVRDASKIRELTELPDNSKVLRFKKGHKFSIVDPKTAVTRHYEVQDVTALRSGLSIDAVETGSEKGETMDELVKKFKRGNRRGSKDV